MKTTKILQGEAYIAPDLRAINLTTEGVLCQSGPGEVSIDDPNFDYDNVYSW